MKHKHSYRHIVNEHVKWFGWHPSIGYMRIVDNTLTRKQAKKKVCKKMIEAIHIAQSYAKGISFNRGYGRKNTSPVYIPGWLPTGENK